MNHEHNQQLIERYPKIFEHRERLWCRDGWFDLIDALCSKLQEISDRTGSQVVARQVKEKFGGLRFYVSKGTTEHADAIAEAEQASHHICEVCGQPGVVKVSAGYVQCRCPAHMPEGARSLEEQMEAVRALRKARDEKT
ncbi:hypothetical protein [Hydrogenophaga sp. PML113]|uniref:hypothetical protein n=1 Tax=Hydrogenophaga sp. PML113 TaxID=1899350 RepID=UPI000878A0B4|nr:hypothetical protein [Hydrogenophaga sp. PML113]